MSATALTSSRPVVGTSRPAAGWGSTRGECLEAAAALYAEALRALASQTPSEAAAAAYAPGGPSLAELTEQITRRSRDISKR